MQCVTSAEYELRRFMLQVVQTPKESWLCLSELLIVDFSVL